MRSGPLGARQARASRLPSPAVSSRLQRTNASGPEDPETRFGSGFPVNHAEAGDGARTHDPQLGKLMLYQLSYARVERIVTAARFRHEDARSPYKRVIDR